jgi:hypothetical protein
MYGCSTGCAPNQPNNRNTEKNRYINKFNIGFIIPFTARALFNIGKNNNITKAPPINAIPPILFGHARNIA